MTEHLITVTMRPEQVVSVNDQELCDLERMGLIASRLPAPDPTPAAPTRKGSSRGVQAQEQPEADG